MIVRIEELGLAKKKNSAKVSEMQYAALDAKGLKPDEENLDDETEDKLEEIERNINNQTPSLGNRNGNSITHFVRRNE